MRRRAATVWCSLSAGRDGRHPSAWYRAVRSGVGERLHRVAVRTMLRREIRSGLSHQPLGEFPPTHKRPLPFFADRLALLREVAKECSAGNALDIGCAEGYFIRGLAQDPGLIGVGLESDWNALRKGLALRSLQAEERYAFVPIRFDAQSLRRLPAFDLVICFWVLHHVIRNGGREAGVSFLRGCADVTSKKFVFAMGGPLDEGSPAAAAKLAFLGDDHQSIAAGMRQLLIDAGFQRCEIRAWASVHGVSGDTDGVGSGNPIFVCDPPSRT
jgi:SAM-dependent methyltransferase